MRWLRRTKRGGGCEEGGRLRCVSGTVKAEGPARRGRCECPRCGHVNALSEAWKGTSRAQLFAIEYYNPCEKGRASWPVLQETRRGGSERGIGGDPSVRTAVPRFVPDDAIPAGDETSRLHRWGIRALRELFNDRQLLGLELICRRIAEIGDERLRRALATNLSDLLPYQNMLCRYDTMALKALDIFSVHGFPVGLIQCESNLLGIANGGTTSVGSGGWTNIVQKYRKAKAYCRKPLRSPHRGRPQGARGDGRRADRRGAGNARRVSIQCMSATKCNLAPRVSTRC